MAEVTESVLFRQKLYQNFKQSGMLQKLKTSLRMNLLQKLQKPAVNYGQKHPGTDKKPLYLRDKFLACIIGQYMQKTMKQCSLSIFLPQSELDQSDCLNFNELAEILNFNQNSETGIDEPRVSFLQKLIQQWMRIRAIGVNERSTQTDHSEPVSKKLQDIQKKYRKQIDYWKLIPNSHSSIRRNQNSSTQNLDAMAKQQRMREQFELQKKRIKRDLQGVIKAELQKRFQDKYSTKLKQVQKSHQGRLFELKNRQKSILDSLNKKTKDIQLKAHKVKEDELLMIKKYETKINQLELEHKLKIKQLQKKQKQFWKKQIQLRAKKKEYEDSIRLIKQKVIEQTLTL